MPIRPSALGLVMCELVIEDQKTHNVSAINCFSRRIINGPIENTPPFYVVANLVNGHGTMPARIVIERLDTAEATYERDFTLAFASPLAEITGTFRIRTDAIPVYGDYHAMLFADREVIAMKKFSIVSKEAMP